ncbi:protein-lysine N-methyltransferase Ecym_4161 [Eremothecium cymbalariae DBVPG|uniref:SET domain-containing protein n=1 Tax=Eremothecium cymbalariae (strain CBS 270.75 / DBVPG 7215 / KCTC 17166 / NRRL Y-17582) TaxID=931890 RepID=G8JT85_ERECY|nr:hypothetical protein Ecym_4161 [Eremothecium cymbalariae DBVPG\
MPMRKIENLLEWLKQAEGAFISEKIGILEDDIFGRGVLLVDGSLRRNEELVSIPSEYQLNFHSVIYHISKFNKKLVVPGVSFPHGEKKADVSADDPRIKGYGILTTGMVLNMSSFQLLNLYILTEWFLLDFWSESKIESFWRPFFDIFPIEDDLKCIPAYYNCKEHSVNRELIPYLSNATKKQMEKISHLILWDWKCIYGILSKWNELFKDKKLPSVAAQYRYFLHIYFVINSRCLYTEVPLKKSATDKFTMVPFVDFMNHTPKADMHCYPSVDESKKHPFAIGKFSIKCGRHEYNFPGDQIFLNYGAHSNDFLLSEYGFTVKDNEWDFIDISEIVMALIESPKQKEYLVEQGYWGDYTISKTDISFRLLVALALIVTDDYRLVDKYMMGYITDEYFKPKYRDMLIHMLTSLRKSYIEALRSLSELTKADPLCVDNVITVYHGYLKIIDSHLQIL